MHSNLRLGKLQDTFVPSGKDQRPHRCLNAGGGGLLFHLQAVCKQAHTTHMMRFQLETSGLIAQLIATPS